MQDAFVVQMRILPFQGNAIFQERPTRKQHFANKGTTRNQQGNNKEPTREQQRTNKGTTRNQHRNNKTNKKINMGKSNKNGFWRTDQGGKRGGCTMLDIKDLGEVVITRGLHNAVSENEDTMKEVYGALARYMGGDWGDLPAEDKEMNDNAVKAPGSDRILARYNLKFGDIYIITEWDRSYTTLMFCSEY